MERHFLGAAAVAKLTSDLGGTDQDRSIPMSTMQGWDFTTGQVFEVSVDRGLATEEKMLCVIGSKNADGTGTLSVYVDPVGGHVYRGWDDTVVQRHAVGARVEHIWSATDAREALGAARSLSEKPAHKHQTWGDLFTPPAVVPAP